MLLDVPRLASKCGGLPFVEGGVGGQGGGERLEESPGDSKLRCTGDELVGMVVPFRRGKEC